MPSASETTKGTTVITEHLRAVSTGQLSDALDRLALPRGGCYPVGPLHPGDKLVGRAFTVLFGRVPGRAPLHDYLTWQSLVACSCSPRAAELTDESEWLVATW